MSSTETHLQLQHFLHNSKIVCPRSCCSSPNPRKRKGTMTGSTCEPLLDHKRFRSIPQWLNLVEHVTPENALSSVYTVQSVRPFLSLQFEPEDPRNRRLKEMWIADSLTRLLEQTCAANNSFQYEAGRKGPYRSQEYPDGSSSIFFSLKKPSIVLSNYILRLVRYMQVSKSVFVVALIYLDRLRHEDMLLSLNYLNVHRLLTTALTLAAKYLEDESHRNSTIARIGGIPSTVEMNMLELQFLRRIGWNCAVSPVAYEAYERTAFGLQPCHG